MSMQLFGSVQLPHGSAKAMLCTDADRPHEFMVHLWGLDDTAFSGVLLRVKTEDEASVSLEAVKLFKTLENGGFFLPDLSADEVQGMKSLAVHLTKSSSGFNGTWSGLSGKTGVVKFERETELGNIKAELCNDWASFKIWATQARRDHNAAIFRGHGSSRFRLQTTLARVGRHRVQRYCMETLAEFHLQTEAVLGMRLNMNDGYDYSVVLGLAQHHGLPTPLLDWTESPYIAAFFAFADALDSEAYRLGHTHVRIFGLTREFVDGTSPPNVVLHQAPSYVASLAISPRHNPRLLAQQGKFLVTNIADLDHWFVNLHTHIGKQVLYAIDVPISCARDALEDLAFMGLTAASMFPGLDGVCKKMRHQMSFVTPTVKAGALPSSGELVRDVTTEVDRAAGS